jgi:hypothetical protein
LLAEWFYFHSVHYFDFPTLTTVTSLQGLADFQGKPQLVWVNAASTAPAFDLKQ